MIDEARYDEVALVDEYKRELKAQNEAEGKIEAVQSEIDSLSDKADEAYEEQERILRVLREHGNIALADSLEAERAS